MLVELNRTDNNNINYIDVCTCILIATGKNLSNTRAFFFKESPLIYDSRIYAPDILVAELKQFNLICEFKYVK